MEERLNEIEKCVLNYIKTLYKEKYAIRLKVIEKDCCEMANIDKETLDNILRGLCVRNYISSVNQEKPTEICLNPIGITEKALNLFNDKVD